MPLLSLYTLQVIIHILRALLHAKWISMVDWASVHQDVGLRLWKNS